jgi:uncharacterized protein (DUF4415 family)
MTKEFDPAHAKANGYTLDDWNDVDSPDATDEELAQAKSFSDAFPALAGKIRRGRPLLDAPKVAVSMRLDPDLLDALKAGGKGWQSRVNAILREAVGL